MEIFFIVKTSSIRPTATTALVQVATTLDKSQPFHCRFIAEMVGAVGIEPTTSPV
jgi:hypothetical protein